MSSLALFNSSGAMPFLVLTAIFLFVSSAIFTMWSNLKQKIFDELSARITKIINADISKIKNEIYSNFTTEINSRDAGHTTEAQKILTMVKKPVIMNLAQSELLLKFFKMIWFNVMQ